jgi:hypothetical protein
MDGGDALRAMPNFEVSESVGAGIVQRGFDPLCLCVARIKVILPYTNTSFLFEEVNPIGYYIIGQIVSHDRITPSAYKPMKKTNQSGIGSA